MANSTRNPLRVSLKPDPVWAFLEERDISQNELVRLAGISPGYLSQLMSGVRWRESHPRRPRAAAACGDPLLALRPP